MRGARGKTSQPPRVRGQFRVIRPAAQSWQNGLCKRGLVLLIY